MPYKKFGDLPGQSPASDSSKDRLFVGTLYINRELLLQSGAVIRSINYESGSTGFVLRYDGTIELNDAVLRGDLFGNWDGGTDLSAGMDTGATTGFFFDASAGNAQINGGLYVGGAVYVTGSISSNYNLSSGSYITLNKRIYFGTVDGVGSSVDGYIWVTPDADTEPELVLRAPEGSVPTSWTQLKLGTQYIQSSGDFILGGDTILENSASLSYASYWRYNFADSGAQIRIQPSSATQVSLWLEGWNDASHEPTELRSYVSSGNGAFWILVDSAQVARFRSTDIYFYSGGSNYVAALDQSRLYISTYAAGNKLRLEADAATSDYMEFYRGGSREGWFGFGSTGDNITISNETVGGNVDLTATNGSSVAVARVRVDGNAGISFYGNDENLKFVVENSQVRFLDDVPISLGTDNDYYLKYSSGSNVAQFYFKPTSGTGVLELFGNGGSTLDVKLLDGNLYLNDMYLKRGSNSALHVQTSYGYALIGPQNASYCHIYTDAPSFYFNKSTLYANGSKIWHAGNDGPSSGLDADTVDGYHASSFGKLGSNNTWTGVQYTAGVRPSADSSYSSGTLAYTWSSMRTISIYRDNEYANSARKLKKSISSDVPGLELISVLQPRQFQWRTGEGFKPRADQYKYKWGFVAEEVHEAVSQIGLDLEETALPAFDEDGDPIYSPDQLVPVLWKAIQQQQKQIEDLQKQVAGLIG